MEAERRARNRRRVHWSFSIALARSFALPGLRLGIFFFSTLRTYGIIEEGIDLNYLTHKKGTIAICKIHNNYKYVHDQGSGSKKRRPHWWMEEEPLALRGHEGEPRH